MSPILEDKLRPLNTSLWRSLRKSDTTMRVDADDPGYQPNDLVLIDREIVKIVKANGPGWYEVQRGFGATHITTHAPSSRVELIAFAWDGLR